MGIMNFIRSQLIDIIEWLDDSNYTLVWRFPDEDHELSRSGSPIHRMQRADLILDWFRRHLDVD